MSCRSLMTATVHGACAGVRSVLPAASVARTAKRVRPSASPAYACGEPQSVQAPPSRRHSNVESASLDANEKLAVPVATVPLGPVVIVVFGGSRSGIRQRSGGRGRRTMAAGAAVASADGPAGSLAGLRPSSSSTPSFMPSRSVSRLRGLVFERRSSKPSLSPSRSVSARRGLVLDWRTS